MIARWCLFLIAMLGAAQAPASLPDDEWPSYARDAAETNYSPLAQIDTNNIARLSLAWSTRTGAPRGGRVEATPILNGGVLYMSLSMGVIAAIDARTGEQVWTWDPHIDPKSFFGCCGPVNRGVAVHNGKVYAGLIDGRLIALDQRDGKLAWSVQVTKPGSAETLTAAIRVVKNKVIVGSAGAEYLVRGYFSAYDPDNGKLLWRFYTVPGDPSKPFEHPELEMAAKTWTGRWWEIGGGGTVWQAIAYDAELDLLYVGTGNGSPWNQRYRSPQGGDNLFLASILAVRPDTGRLVWHYQVNPGESWDYTATQSLILADLNLGGRVRKAVMQAPKNGFFYVLDRETGEFLSAAPYAQVNWATGIDAQGRPIENPSVRYGEDFAELHPGTSGAHNWTPMAFSPRTGLAYVSGEETVSYLAHDANFTPRDRQWSGAVLRRPSRTLQGFLLAWDPVEQRQRWRVTAAGAGSAAGGAMVTAGGLVFHGGAAYDAATGQKLWTTSIDTLDQPAAWISYALDGQQYVAVLARRWPENALFVFTLDGDGWFPWNLRPIAEEMQNRWPYLAAAGLMLCAAVAWRWRRRTVRR